MHEILAKIARLAVSKAAAFGYAVAVGVAGNLAFNFVQQQHSAPATMTAPAAVQPAIGAAPVVQPMPAVAPVPAPTRIAPSAAPVAPRPAAANPPLPEPPAAFALPNPATMPVPALRPTALPAHPHAAPQASEDRAGGEAALQPATVAKPGPASPGAPSASASAPIPATALPPLGPAIEVSAPPSPPAPDTALNPAIEAATPRRSAITQPPPVPADPANQAEPPRTWELSDIWHPTRAVEKGLHWAGEQVPTIGSDGTKARSPVPAPAGPIPLWPAATAERSPPDIAKGSPATQAKPGPGSGGLY